MARVTLPQLEQLLLDAAELLGKMDIAAKRNYVFALLLLKRCSDAFDDAWQREYQAELAGGGSESDAREVADDRDSYTDVVFVPTESRWNEIAAQSEHLGNKLNDALTALERTNEDLDGVLRHIDFNRAPGGERLSDATLRELNRLMSTYRLGDDDLEFPELIGVAYEKVLRDFAESAGSTGGDFYTPRPVVRLMVRLADPQPGESVYDPCAGSAGMLILAREHVTDHHPGSGRQVSLAGQELATAQWVAARMNLLLHGVRDAELRLGDTLTEPRHVIGGSLRRFHKILSNPEFSRDYDAAELARNARGRFPHGVIPKGDLMFVQHMVSALRDGGLAVTVMPHGVLFRSAKEKEIRAGLLRDDAIEAVIGLGPGIFHGTGIPACLMLLRAPGAKPGFSRGKVLFINADREFTPGRTSNHLGEEHIEKIVRTYRDWREIDGFSRVVTTADLLADDANLNIRRWVDNTPPPEPQDVGAHLYGGVPRAEVEAARSAFSAYGLDPLTFFSDADHDYLDFLPEGSAATADRIAELAWEREEGLRTAFAGWWSEQVTKLLTELSGSGTTMAARSTLIDSFLATLKPHAILDEFTLIGVIAEWWGASVSDLKSLAASGPKQVVEGWATAVEIMLAPQRIKGGKTKPVSAAQRRAAREHPLIPLLLSAYVAELGRWETLHADFDAKVKVAESDEADEGEGGNSSSSDAVLTLLKKGRTQAGQMYSRVEKRFVGKMVLDAVDKLSREQAEILMFDVFRDDLRARIDSRLAAARRVLIARFRVLAEKYEVSLAQLEQERDAAAVRLAGYLEELGYPRKKRIVPSS